MPELKDIPLFSGLSTEQLQELQRHIQVRHYTKDSIVFYEGDESDYLHLLLDGTVRLYKTTPKGTQVHIHNFEAPEIIAIFAAFEKIPFPATCEFLIKGTVGLIPLKQIYNCLHNVDFSLALISSLSKRMKVLSDILHKETVFSSEAKIADLIYNNATSFQHLKNNQIASILNITPETLSRTLTKLKKEGIIIIDNHVMTILNKSALEHIITTNSMQTS